MSNITVAVLLKELTEMVSKNPSLINSPIYIGGREDGMLNEAFRLYTVTEDDATVVVINECENA